MRIRIVTDSTGPVEATLTDESPDTAKRILEALPIEARVELGDLAYWPPGKAFCIFFGRTPASRGDEIRPASAVNVFGKVEGDPKVFKKVRSGERVRIERG